MKKILTLCIFMIAIAGVVGATPVMCDVVIQPNTSNIVLSDTCTVNPDPGFYISTLTLSGYDSFTGGARLPIVDFTGTLSQTTAVFSIPSFCEVSSDIFSDSVNCNFTVLPASTQAVNLSTYTVGISAASNTELRGTISAASINLILDFAETEIPVTGAPEPATLGLLGAGLLGFGIIARKKK
jgi:PEP-CTERM motif